MRPSFTAGTQIQLYMAAWEKLRLIRPSNSACEVGKESPNRNMRSASHYHHVPYRELITLGFAMSSARSNVTTHACISSISAERFAVSIDGFRSANEISCGSEAVS